MADITLRVLDGADRGRVYEAIPTPITIGREEGNTIQLNDERISRFHVKIQEDEDKLILTDLESTNGSKVNGEDIQLRILRYGDVIHVGRSLLLLGTREQISERLEEMRSADLSESRTLDIEQLADKIEAASMDIDVDWSEDPDLLTTLHNLEPPELPDKLTAGQTAQIAELLEYFHHRLRELVAGVKIKHGSDVVRLDQKQWQHILDLQSQLSVYLRRIADPGQQE